MSCKIGKGDNMCKNNHNSAEAHAVHTCSQVLWTQREGRTNTVWDGSNNVNSKLWLENILTSNLLKNLVANLGN